MFLQYQISGLVVSVRSIAISLSVYLSLCSHISKTISPNLTKFSVHVNCGHDLVLL